jgi:hypothetical protein
MPGLSSLKVNIKDQPHNLAWINEAEQALLKDLGGSGRPGPMGIPAYPFDDFDDPEGDFDDPSGTFGGGAEQAAEDVNTGDITDQMGFGDPGAMGFTDADLQDYEDAVAERDIDPDALSTDAPGLTAAEAEAALAAAEDPEAPYEDQPYREVPIYEPPSQYRTTEYAPEDKIASALINMIFGAAVPGAGIARLAGFNPGKMLAGETTRSYYSNKKGEELNPYTEPPRDDFGQQEYIDKVDKANIANLYPQEKNQEELGAMAQSFNNKENSEVLRNITERLTAQNKSIEPFNEWLAGQSEAMQAADTTTQTNEYRKSLRDAIPTSESYRPIVQPATNTVEQEFINKLYASPTKLSPTQALFDELGIV